MILNIENIAIFKEIYNDAIKNDIKEFTFNDKTWVTEIWEEVYNYYQLDDMKDNIFDVFRDKLISDRVMTEKDEEGILNYIDKYNLITSDVDNVSIDLYLCGKEVSRLWGKRVHSLDDFKRKYITKTGVSEDEIDNIIVNIKTRMINPKWLDGDTKEKILYDIYKLWYIIK